MTAYSEQGLKTVKDTAFANNSSEAITPTVHRNYEEDQIDSSVNKVDGSYLRIATATAGTQPAYTITFTDKYPTSYTEDIAILFKAHATSTGAATLNVNAIGAKDILRPDGTATQSGDIVQNKWYMVSYNSSIDDFTIFEGFGGGLNLTDTLTLTGDALRVEGTSADGSDNDSLYLAPFNHTGTSETDGSRGAWIGMHGNEFASFGGQLWLVAGNGSSAEIRMYTNNSIRLEIDENGEITANGDFKANAKLSIGDRSELTIATGAVTVTNGYHDIDTESDAATDDLDTINGGITGQVLVIKPENDARTVVVKDGTGNINLLSDFSMTGINYHLTLIYDGSNWVELSRTAIT